LEIGLEKLLFFVSNCWACSNLDKASFIFVLVPLFTTMGMDCVV